MDVKIISMEIPHIPAVARIDKMCFSTPWSERAYHDEFANPNSYTFIACIGNEVIGYVNAAIVLDECSINNIAIIPNYRKKRIAPLLLITLENLCRERGVSFITLEVRVSNHAARRLYRKAGFDDVGIRKGFYKRPDEDAILMTKYL
ncbi:MAG: ribosomal protein S18-alanine N-acetyltransferase [Clostridiales bacterium]|mgnify:CR=1 FL=1|nr:ribosomal protein S18-alanine N-acetyltransferase [Clostridiales bacterium]